MSLDILELEPGSCSGLGAGSEHMVLRQRSISSRHDETCQEKMYSNGIDITTIRMKTV